MYRLKTVDNLFEIEGFYTAQRFDWDGFFVFDGESHNFWEAVFVESGKVEVTEDEKAYTLSDGNMIFHAPMKFHRIKSAVGSEPKGFIFTFQASGDLPYAIRSGVFTVNSSQRKIYEELRECIYDFVHKEPSSLLQMKAATLLKLLIIKLTENSTTIGSSTTHSALEYQRISSFMSKNVCENMTLDDIAEKTNVSVSYMKFLFNTYVGFGPKRYFNLLRVQRASELLSGGHSVTEVSNIMNFSSPNYFSVFYKKHTGSPPSQRS